MGSLYAKNTIYVLKWNYKATENPRRAEMSPFWIYTLIFGHLDNPISAGQHIKSNPCWVFVIFVALTEAVPVIAVHHWIPHRAVVFSPVTNSVFPWPYSQLQSVWLNTESDSPLDDNQLVSVPPQSTSLYNPLQDQSFKGPHVWLFRSSSGEVFSWKSAKVPALQCLVNGVNEGVNHLSHVSGERLKGGPLRPRAFEMSVLVALGAEQPLLGQSDVQEGSDETQLREESPLQLLVVHHQQAASELQPAQSVGCPPGGVAGDKFWPFCRWKENTVDYWERLVICIAELKRLDWRMLQISAAQSKMKVQRWR